MTDMAYLELLSESFPDAVSAAGGIADAEARLGLLKPVELFVSDVHGEYEEFSHILKNACGGIRRSIDAAFGSSLNAQEKDALVSLVCYPREKAALASRAQDAGAWQARAVAQLTTLLAYVAARHTRAQVRAALPKAYAGMVEELLAAERPGMDAEAYLARIVETVVRIGCADSLIQALAAAIQRLSVARLHLVGDVYDRGPQPDLIMDLLAECPSVDIQWGNHDVVWMGAALGQPGCIAHVVRNCARYANLSILTDGYGINLLPLITFALDAYKDDPCAGYALKGSYPELSERDIDINVKVQKAMAVLQFKVEAQLIDENPSFGLEDRKLLDKIDWDKGTVVVDGTEWPLTDTVFPTVDPVDPYRLTPAEQHVMACLAESFENCEKLQRHMRLFLDRGSLYKIENDTLMYHACVPLNADGSLKEVELYGETYKGKSLFDAVDRFVRDAFDAVDPAARKRGSDLLWYLWLGQGSPLFAKSKMATFEIYEIADKAARKEVKNPYYSLLENQDVLDGIFRDFGMDPTHARIVSGHVPVKVKDGEDPVKCNGKALIIDGGMSAAYRKTTGIAGFTLVSDDAGVHLASHKPFAGTRAAVEQNADLESTWREIEKAERPLLVESTDEGALLQQRKAALEDLLAAYRNGSIAERARR